MPMNNKNIQWLAVRINLYMQVIELYDPNLHGSNGFHDQVMDASIAHKMIS